jgi:hypothetical protein
MNCSEFQNISLLRLEESKVLFNQSYFCGSYYLAGYSIECAFKVCIAKMNIGSVLLKQFYTHALIDLANYAGLYEELIASCEQNKKLYENWNIVRYWKETSRYQSQISQIQASDLLVAIETPKNGVLPWIKSKW